MYNTRIAPSPTGDMHLGTARTAYFNWLAARSTGGKFYLRIDDTDKERSREEYVHIIQEVMGWLDLDCETFRQSERIDRYNAVICTLLRCEVAGYRDNAVVLKPYGVADYWKDEIAGKVEITEDDKEHCQGLVLRKSDGMPTYHFATVVDDHDYEINYVIRGHDHITNTSRQIAIYNALDWSVPQYAHVGLLAMGGKPLSKRDKASSILAYKQKGYHPEAVLNFMARLGWGPTVDDKTTKLLPREMMLELFLEGGKMRNSLANIDLKKLDSFDRKYKARN